MTLKWLLFDLDNTLLDFDAGAQHSLSKTLADHGLEDNETLLRSYQEINHRCWQRFENGEIDIPTLKKLRFEIFAEKNELRINPHLLNRYYLDLLALQIEEVTGARQLLNHSSAKFSLVLVTNGFAEVQRPRMERSGLASYFKHIVISEEIGFSKPATAFFNHAFQLMGNPDLDQVMIIGDSLSSDIKGGLQSGIQTCWYNPNGSAIGDDLIPHHMVTSLEDIPLLWS